MKYSWLPVLFCLLLAAPTAVRADVAAGQHAYEAGDFKTAMAEWLPLAETGNAEAALRIGMLYRDGLGVGVDQDAAFRWFDAAGRSNDAALLREAGKALDKMKDYDAGMIHVVRLLKDAAAKGDAEAMHIIGKAFLFGDRYKEYNFARIYPANPAFGVDVLRHAVDKGYVPAISTLAFAIFEGLGVAKDEAKAIDLATKGAEMGDPDSQFALIGFHYLAEPPRKDDMKSVTWAMVVYYSLPEGSSLRDSALSQALAPSSHLSDAEIETAKASARAWIKEHGGRSGNVPRAPGINH